METDLMKPCVGPRMCRTSATRPSSKVGSAPSAPTGPRSETAWGTPDTKPPRNSPNQGREISVLMSSALTRRSVFGPRESSKFGTVTVPSRTPTMAVPFSSRGWSQKTVLLMLRSCSTPVEKKDRSAARRSVVSPPLTISMLFRPAPGTSPTMLPGRTTFVLTSNELTSYVIDVAVDVPDKSHSSPCPFSRRATLAANRVSFVTCSSVSRRARVSFDLSRCSAGKSQYANSWPSAPKEARKLRS
mmetsp:Transcript_32608/g.83132  ORF Transcript_32608/g.83132 Transcript_32608/m.83132 type:complete len:244 (-) Transcript_32608:266-997(-)